MHIIGKLVELRSDAEFISKLKVVYRNLKKHCIGLNSLSEGNILRDETRRMKDEAGRMKDEIGKLKNDAMN